MQKIILILIGIIFLILVLLSQYREEVKEKKINTPAQVVKQKELDSQIEIKTKETDAKPIATFTQKKQLSTPFTQNMDMPMQKDIVIQQNLEELEIEALNTIQPLINEEMQNIPACLEIATNKEEAFKCSESLRVLNKDLAMAMGDFNEEIPTGYDDDFIWNEKTKVDMIREIEEGTQAMQEMQMCMQTSKTPKELEKCLKP